MNNPFKGLGGSIKKITSPKIKLKFSTCGEVMIDGLPFSFGVESDGLSSDKGLVVSISGDAVDGGRLTFNEIELDLRDGTKVKTEKRKLERVAKKDGKRIYQARFPEVFIPVCPKEPLSFKRNSSQEDFLNHLSSEISFKVVPTYKEPDESEIMITVYPIENPLDGLAVQWKNCTSDKDYFLHKFSRN